MIFFLVTPKNRHPIEQYLHSLWGYSFFNNIQPLNYEWLLGKKKLLPGAYIFSDIELLNEEDRKAAQELFDHLSSIKDKVYFLNHPSHSKRRYDLLKSLHEQGINSFNVYRLNEDRSAMRYPVFLRFENDHYGARSGLIFDEHELKGEIKKITLENLQWNQCLICELCDTSDNNGIYRKYSSFMVDGNVIPRHIFFSSDWHIKRDDLYNEEFFNEEMEYIRSNPHRKTLQSIFEEARIDYGRIDYSVKDDQIQVWEINTNPMILTSRMLIKSLRSSIHQTFSKDIALAWRSLYAKSGAKSINYPLEKLR